jgi:hypothetical protein
MKIKFSCPNNPSTKWSYGVVKKGSIIGQTNVSFGTNGLAKPWASGIVKRILVY